MTAKELLFDILVAAMDAEPRKVRLRIASRAAKELAEPTVIAIRPRSSAALRREARLLFLQMMAERTVA